MQPVPLLSELLANGPCEREDAPFRLVQIQGPDAGEFLHRLCTQDVRSLATGAVRPAAFLDSKGKLLVTGLVGRLGDSFWIEVPAEQLAKLVALLQRYHFTEKLTIAPPAVGSCHETVGLAGGESVAWRAQREGEALRLQFERRGVAFTRVHGATVPLSGTSMTAAMAECIRIGAGLVRVGVETEPSTLALEVDLDDHISTTKGCYTGQEIVARINTYGHTNRRLCLLQLAAGAWLTAPATLHELEDQLAVGRVMHAVPIPGRELRLGVGYLPKDFQAIGTKLALADGTAVEVIGYEALPAGLPA